MPRDQPGRRRREQGIQDFRGQGGGGNRQQAEYRREDHRVEGREMHTGWHPGKIGMHVAVAGRDCGREAGVQPIVVKDTDERLIQRQQPDGQYRGRGDEPRSYFVRGTNRL